MPLLPVSTIDPHAAGCLAAVVVLVAAWTDIRSHKIYNSLTYPAMVGGLLLAALAGGLGRLEFLSSISAGESLAGLLGCGLLMLVPYHLSRGGAGDVKLAMAMGSLVGFQWTLQGFCVGYILAASYLVARSSIALAGRWVAIGNGLAAGMNGHLKSYFAPQHQVNLANSRSETRHLFSARPFGSQFAAGNRIATEHRRLVDTADAASIAAEPPNMTEPIPLAGFILLGMAAVVGLGPLW